MRLRGAHSHLFDIYEIVILDQGVYYSVLKGKHKINQAKGHTTFQKVFSQLNLSLSLYYIIVCLKARLQNTWMCFLLALC